MPRARASALFRRAGHARRPPRSFDLGVADPGFHEAFHDVARDLALEMEAALTIHDHEADAFARESCFIERQVAARNRAPAADLLQLLVEVKLVIAVAVGQSRLQPPLTRHP